MPTYEYRCPEGHVFERVHKISQRPRARCPECGKLSSRKISGGAVLVFKGSGFYITDYGKDGKGPKKPAETEASAPETKTSASETKAETKPTSPPATKSEKSPSKKAGE